MKKLLITAFVALTFAACTTKETSDTTTEKTVSDPQPTVIHDQTIVHDQAPASNPAPVKEKQNRVEVSISDTGSGMKVKIP